MATLILGTVGRIFAGPIGGLVGTAIGGLVDRSVLGGGRARENGRVANPVIQGATFGEPIPIVTGRMRTAGNLIWTSGISEQAATSGGGKRSGPSTTSYSYFASFAVGLAARRIIGIERIWADGKLIRDTGGSFLSPVTMRLHSGSADQSVDPLIAAAEGVGGTPAYRGLAYAVFEDLPLANYGNRIPNLTFEVVADEGLIDAGTAIAAIATAAGHDRLVVAGDFPPLTGHVAGRLGSLAEALAPLLSIANAVIVAGAQGEIIVAGSGQTPTRIGIDATDAQRPGEHRRTERSRRTAAQAGSLDLAFYDTTRDYQPGLQCARRSASSTIEHRSIAAAMSPLQAKSLAMTLLAAGQAARSRRSIRLAWRHVGLLPGTLVTLGTSTEAFRVCEARFEGFVVHLDLEGTVPDLQPLQLPTVSTADGGRSMAFAAEPVGPTTLLVLDLPGLPGEAGVSPRLWVAGNGAGSGWRRSGVDVSFDEGASFQTMGTLEGGSVIGTTVTKLPDGNCAGWDRFGSVEVELLNERDWLEGRTAASVLAGGNLGLIGDELIQFSTAHAIGSRRFRLSGLLRGRRGSELASSGHRIGERFVLIDPIRMLPIDLPLEMIDRPIWVRTADARLSDRDAIVASIAARALRPLAPAHLCAQRAGDDIVVAWKRRSRSGFGWIDFVDAPLDEAVEGYRVCVERDGQVAKHLMATVPTVTLSIGELGGSGRATISVAQLSAATGPGDGATITIDLEANHE